MNSAQRHWAPYWHPDAPNGGNGGPKWTAAQRAAIKRAVNTYKTRIRPLVRSGNLYHIFPRPDDKIWDGVEYFDPATGKGAVYVFRPGSPNDRETVRLKGLDARVHYGALVRGRLNRAVAQNRQGADGGRL